MGKIENEDICPIKVISFDSDASMPEIINDTMKLDVINQLIKYTNLNRTEDVDITFQTVPISFENNPSTNRSIANEQTTQMKDENDETIIDSSNVNSLYSDLEYLDEFEPVVQTFIEKPASVSHLDKIKKEETCLETNTTQTDTDVSVDTSDDTSDGEDAIVEYLGRGLPPSQVSQLLYIDSVIKDLSEKYKKRRSLDHSVLETKCNFFCEKVKQTIRTKALPKQVTTYVFKKKNETRAIAEWNRKDYDQFGNVTHVVSNAEILKRVEWDSCRKVLDKRKKEVVVPALTSGNGEAQTTRCTLILNADEEKDDRYLTVFNTRNNSVFQMKIEEATENTNPVNVANLDYKLDSYLSDQDGIRRKYIPKRDQSSYVVKMKMTDKGFLCTMCKKLFAKKNNYDEHMRKHFAKKKTDSRKLSDPIKSENQTLEGSFKPCSSSVYKRTPRSGKPFMCDECGRSVKRLDSFRHHLMSHAGVKPHCCPICERRFLQKHALKIHQLVHTGEQPFPCNICPKRFKKMFSLRVHLKVAHNISYPKTNPDTGEEDSNTNEEMEGSALKTEELGIKADELDNKINSESADSPM